MSIRALDGLLCEWVRDVLGEVEVALGPPEDGRAGNRVAAHLFALQRAPALQGQGRAPLLLQLGYLVSVEHKEPDVAHEQLGRLVVAALEHKEYEAEVAPIASEVWRSYGVVPRPAFVLRVPWRVDRPERRGRPVTKPIEVTALPMCALRGVVVGPQRTPVPAAVVRVPSLGRRVTTDRDGRFVLRALPSGGAPLALEVRARGHTQRVDLQVAAGGDEIEIHMDELLSTED